MVKMHKGSLKYVDFLAIFLIIAIAHGFVIEDACTVNGEICQQDNDCCSNWCIFQGHFWSTTCKATSNCYGNCPSNVCRTCQCPPTKNIIDIDAYCASDSGWNSKCCKCIVTRLSAGNSNFERYRENNEAGVLPIDQETFYWNPCNIKTQKPCDSQANKQCAQIIYKQTNSWAYWQDDARACGCFN